MKKKNFILFCFFVVSFALISPQHAIGAFPSKPIVIILPAGPGGGYDAYAKALAPHLKKNLPKKVNIIIKHMPGSGMMRAANAIYRAKPDGHTIGYFSIPGMVIGQLTQKTKYDLRKVTWIGRNDQTPYALTANAKAPFNTIAEMKKHKEPVVFVTQAVGSTTNFICTVIPELMNIPYRTVTGYTGSSQVIVAVMRGDGQLTAFPTTSLYKFYESGDLKPILILDDKRSHLAPNTQTAVELGYPKLTALQLNRLIGGPPGIPADRVKILEQAIMKAEKDPELQKWSKSTEKYYNPLSGAETEKLLNKIFTDMTEFVEIIKKAKK